MSGSCDMDNINFLYKNIELSKLVRVTSQAGAALYDALPVGDIGTATQLYPPQLICRIGVSQYLRVVEERLVVHTKETWLRLSNDEARQRAKTHNIHIHRYNNCWILKSDIEFVNEYDIGTLDIDKEIEEKKRNESTNQTSSSKDQAEPEEIIEDGIHLSGIHSEHLEASVFDKPFIPKLIDSSSTLSKTTSNDDELDLDLDDDDDALTLTKEEEEENHTNSIISNAIDNSENLKLVLNINFQSSNIINRINILNKEIGHDDILLAIINQTFNALPEKGFLIFSSQIISHHLKSSHIISYHIVLYHLISYHIISYHIISHHVILYHIISYHVMSYYIISYHIISYHIISYHIISYHIISHHIISHHIISYHITSYHITSYHIISYHIISYYIISYYNIKIRIGECTSFYYQNSDTGTKEIE